MDRGLSCLLALGPLGPYRSRDRRRRRLSGVRHRSLCWRSTFNSGQLRFHLGKCALQIANLAAQIADGRLMFAMAVFSRWAI
jgi:hypothetical protein